MTSVEFGTKKADKERDEAVLNLFPLITRKELRAELPNKKRRQSEICKKQKNSLAGSRDADGRKKNT
jgi:hypothetical protein